MLGIPKSGLVGLGVAYMRKHLATSVNQLNSQRSVNCFSNRQKRCYPDEVMKQYILSRLIL